MSNREMIKLLSVSVGVRRCPSVSVCKEFLPKCKHMYAQYKLRYIINSSIVKLQTIYCMEYGIIC